MQYVLSLNEAGMAANLKDCASVLVGLADEGRCMLAEAFAVYIFRATPGIVPQEPFTTTGAYGMADGELDLMAVLRAAASRAHVSPWLPPLAAARGATSGIRGTSACAPHAGADAPRPGSVAGPHLGGQSDGGLCRDLARCAGPRPLSAAMSGSGASSTSGQSSRTAVATAQALPAPSSVGVAPLALTEQLACAHAVSGAPWSDMAAPFAQTQLPFAAVASQAVLRPTVRAAKTTWQPQGAKGEQSCFKELARAYVRADRPDRAWRLLSSLHRCEPPLSVPPRPQAMCQVARRTALSTCAILPLTLCLALVCAALLGPQRWRHGHMGRTRRDARLQGRRAFRTQCGAAGVRHVSGVRPLRHRVFLSGLRLGSSLSLAGAIRRPQCSPGGRVSPLAPGCCRRRAIGAAARRGSRVLHGMMRVCRSPLVSECWAAVALRTTGPMLQMLSRMRHM